MLRENDIDKKEEDALLDRRICAMADSILAEKTEVHDLLLESK